MHEHGYSLLTDLNKVELASMHEHGYSLLTDLNKVELASMHNINVVQL